MMSTRGIVIAGVVSFFFWSIVFLTVMAFAEELPQGNRGERHAEMHGFYYDLFNNKKHVSCCHDQDCRPTQSRMHGDHYEVLINSVWMTVDKDTIINKSAPDGGAHVCAGAPTSQDPEGRVYCVILPPET